MQRNLSKRSFVSAVFRNVQKRDKTTKSAATPKQSEEAPTYLNRKPFVNTKIDSISDSRKRSKIYYGQNPPQPDDSPYNAVGQLKLGKAKVERAMSTDAEIDDKLNQHISRLRNGFGEFNGSGQNDSLQGRNWSDLLESIERIDPVVSEEMRKPKSTNTNEWLFNMPTPHPKNGELFVDKMDSWRRGKMANEKEYMKAFRSSVATAPLFRRRIAEDPFRNAPHMAKRISYKNMDLLGNFISAGGNILGRRHTGVTGRAQRRIEREVKKARFLGLVSFTGNPEFVTNKYQPSDSLDYYFDDITEEAEEEELEEEEAEMRPNERYTDYSYPEGTEKLQPAENLEFGFPLKPHPYLTKKFYNADESLTKYIENLQMGIAPNGSLEYEPEPSKLNPHVSITAESVEYDGVMPEQVAEKKKLLKKMLMENMVMKQYGHAIAKAKAEHLEKILAAAAKQE